MRIGYLGLGNMGQPMAGKLLDAGHELWVYDVREDATCSPACAGSGPPQLVLERGPGHSITGLSATFFGAIEAHPHREHSCSKKPLPG